jgi:integrase
VFQKYIGNDPSNRIKPIKTKELFHDYLNMDEIAILMNVECELQDLKRAFLFGCFTGLRISDILNLTWDQLTYTPLNGWQLQYVQVKTKSPQYIPITKFAIDLFDNILNCNDRIFPFLKVNAHTNKKLKEWFKKAGISKRLTFHSSRRSFASNLLATNEVSMKIISSLLGHKNISTTERSYINVAEQNKIAAINKLSFSTN